MVAEGFEILQRHDIDAVKGLANLVWAPNAKGQHGKDALEKVVKALRAADNGGKGTKTDIIEALAEAGKQATRIGQ